MMRNIKVLLLSPLPPPEGGIASWTKHIMNYYNDIKDLSNIQLIHLSTAKKKGRITDKKIWSRLIVGISCGFDILRDFFLLMKKSNPDIVHFTTSASFALFKDYLIQTICKYNKVSNIVHFRFGRIPQLSVEKNWEWKLLIKVIKRSNISIVLDEKSYNILLDKGLKNVLLLPNPISPSILATIEEQRGSVVKRNKKTLLFVGHVIKAKGVYELVKACSDISDLTLELIGPYENFVKDDLLSLANVRDNGEWLIIRGKKDMNYIISAMMQTGIFCLPSYTEGFPNVILESMACGCSIISTNVGAIPEMLNMSDIDNKCGVCVEPQDVESLRAAINLLLNNENLAKEYGENARKRVFSEYDMSNIWYKMTEIWRSNL